MKFENMEIILAVRTNTIEYKISNGRPGTLFLGCKDSFL